MMTLKNMDKNDEYSKEIGYIKNSDDDPKEFRYIAENNYDSKEIGYIDNNIDHSKEFTYIANND